MSPRTPREALRLLRELSRSAASRRELSLCVVEGPHAALDCLAAGVRVHVALVSPRLQAQDGVRTRLEEALASGLVAEVVDVTDDALTKAGDTSTPQGLALIAARPVTTLDACPRAGGLLVAWGVQDPGNLGALVRTAEASGFAALLAGHGARDAATDPLSPRAIRAAAGSAFRLPLAEWTASPADLAARLEAGGRRLVACVPRGGLAPEGLDLTGDVALLLGGEAHGLPADLAARAAPLTIKLAGQVESLNVAAAAAIACFERARQERCTRPPVP